MTPGRRSFGLSLTRFSSLRKINDAYSSLLWSKQSFKLKGYEPFLLEKSYFIQNIKPKIYKKKANVPQKSFAGLYFPKITVTNISHYVNKVDGPNGSLSAGLSPRFLSLRDPYGCRPTFCQFVPMNQRPFRTLQLYDEIYD